MNGLGSGREKNRRRPIHNNNIQRIITIYLNSSFMHSKRGEGYFFVNLINK